MRFRLVWLMWVGCMVHRNARCAYTSDGCCGLAALSRKLKLEISPAGTHSMAFDDVVSCGWWLRRVWSAEWCYIIAFVTFMIHESCVRLRRRRFDFVFILFFVLVQIYRRIAINTVKSHRKSILRKQSESHASTVHKNNNNRSQPAKRRPNTVRLPIEKPYKSRSCEYRCSAAVLHVSAAFMNVNWNENKTTEK